MKRKTDKIMLCVSMAIFGTIGLFTRNISVSSGELALYRAILAAALIFLYLILTKQKMDLKSIGKEVPLLLFSGIAMGINWVLLFQAYRYTTISAATLSYYFAPVIVTVVCPFLFHEKMTIKQVVCFIMSTVGLVLIIGFENMGQGGTDLIGILFGLGAAVFYAAVILLNKLIKSVAGIQRTFWQFVAAILILIPYVACTGGSTLENLDGKGWICLLLVGLIHTGITYCMYFSSLKNLKGQEVAILSYIDPLVAVFVSVTILGEKMTFWQFVGGLLLLGFTLWNEKDPGAEKTWNGQE